MNGSRRFLERCRLCSENTTRPYARRNDGRCKACVDLAAGITVRSHRRAERENASRLENGYQAWAVEAGHYDEGGDR